MYDNKKVSTLLMYCYVHLEKTIPKVMNITLLRVIKLNS